MNEDEVKQEDVEMEDDSEGFDMDISEFNDMPGITTETFLAAHKWMKNRENILEGMKDFIKEFIPVEYQVEFAGSDFGVFNGCLIELQAIGTPGVAEFDDDEPIFKAVKKCSRLYHAGKPVPTKLFLVGLGYQLVMEFDLAPFADAIKDVYDEFDRLGHLQVSHWSARTDMYSYADPEGRKKLYDDLNVCEREQCLAL